ncbi:MULTISPECIES: hypothetical protein [Brevibacterium]|uniref:Uncharacterized protein n=1 Tax=Brevibacterium antiquum CNRZ 918 TaxID=1255637 RepID=A0A2H1KDD4_9MICO|nr:MULTISPECIES: hypothetical protein [Brevibacterium]SMX97716.1 hypothetical protein BANT918_02352 [Brevibacterium antiquum CNRZ 918]
MTIPAIYSQPVAGLENFPVSGDDLAVTKHFLTIVADNEAAAKEQTP